MRVKETMLDDDYIELSQFDEEESNEEVSEENESEREKTNVVDTEDATSINTDEGRDEEDTETNRSEAPAIPRNPMDNLVLGAAAVGALTGLVLLGPRAGVLTGLGFGAAAMTTGTMGDTARAVGEVGVEAGRRAKEIDEEHQVVENTKLAAKEAWGKAKEMDEKHHIIEKTKQTAVAAYHSAVEFEKKHNIIDNVARSIANGANALTERLTQKDFEKKNKSASGGKPGYPSVSPPIELETAIERMMAMGFEREVVVIALKKSNDNLDVAASLLLGD